MNSKKHNSAPFERALEYEIDPVPRSLLESVLSANTDRKRRAAARCASSACIADEQRRSRRTVVVGMGIALYAMLMLALVVLDARQQQLDPLQDPRAGEGQLEVVQPGSHEELKALLAHVRSVRVRNVIVDGRGAGLNTYVELPLTGAASVELPEQDRQRLVAELVNGTVVAGASLAPWAMVEFELAGKRLLRASYDFHSKHSLHFAKLGAKRLPAELADQLRAAVQRSERRAIRAQGIVSGIDALRALPPTIDRVVAFRIAGADLGELRRREHLRHLDIAAIEGPTEDDVFAGLAGRRELRSLVVHPRHIAQLNVKAHAPNVRSLTLDFARRGTLATGANCVICHSTDNPQPRPLRAPLTAVAELRELEHVGLRSAVVPAAFAGLLGELPLLRSVDLSGCDVSMLPPQALARIPALRRLTLTGATGVSLEWMQVLAGIKYLERLDARMLAGVSDQDLAELQESLPNCRIRK